MSAFNASKSAAASFVAGAGAGVVAAGGARGAAPGTVVVVPAFETFSRVDVE